MSEVTVYNETEFSCWAWTWIPIFYETFFWTVCQMAHLKNLSYLFIYLSIAFLPTFFYV